MIKYIALFTLLAATFGVLSGCGSTVDSNANMANGVNMVGVGPVNLNGSNLPAGISNNPIIMNGNTVMGTGANTVRPGATPTPGIPDPANVNVKMKPGATPTPGIPSPEEMRRQMQRLSNGSAAATDPPSMRSTNSAPSMMRSTNSAPSMMRSVNANSPRSVRRP